MDILFVTGVAPITSDPAASAALYRDQLGLPLDGDVGDYLFSERLGGLKHFGVWPLALAAQSCFGSDTWPEGVPVPQATVEFELADVAAVSAAVDELQSAGLTFIHGVRLEGWGQTTARFLSPEGLLLGLTYTPSMHEDAPADE